ncbi:MAG TPA: hypothetical protein VGO62_13160 [Myxococcota bacterium]
MIAIAGFLVLAIGFAVARVVAATGFVGRQVGPYRLQRKIARGVWLASHAGLGREVALWLFPTGRAPRRDDDTGVLDRGDDGALAYVAMEVALAEAAAVATKRGHDASPARPPFLEPRGSTRA